MSASNEGFDAKDVAGKCVEIKATQSSSVAFRSCPPHTIIVLINKDATFETCYNGPGDIIWEDIKDRPRQRNGQYSITLNRVRELDSTVRDDQRVVAVAHQGHAPDQ
jgi:hypothetical protein